MNKSTVIFAALALLAASCTKTEVVSCDAQGSQRGIGFSAYTAKPTKAAPQTDVTISNFNSFEVTAIGKGAVYFDNVTFNWKSGSKVWESDPLYFWPAYALDFYAYNTPANGNGTFTRNITDTDPKTLTLTYSPAADLDKQEDLVAAYAGSKTESNATSTNNSLALTFNHYLTQVIVKAKSSNANYKIVVDGVKLANIVGNGTYTFSDNKMTAGSTADADYDEIFTTGKTLTTEAQEVMTNAGTGKWYLIPQTTLTAWNQETDKSNNLNGAYLGLKVKITNADGSYKVYPSSGNQSAWMAIPISTSKIAFAQGKRYTVVVNFFGNNGAGYVDPEVPGDLDGDGEVNDDNGKSIIGGAITFNATVSDWAPETEIVIDL